MLSEKEKHGMAELLGRMEKSDLISLSQTVTSRLILPETSSEAVTSIILHTDRASDLLKRKKMKKEFLFKYLHDKRVEGVEGSSDKSVLIRHVLTLWDSNERSLSLSSCLALTTSLSVGAHEEDSLPEAPAPSRNTSYSSLCSLDLYNNSSGSHHPPSLAMILNRTTSASSNNLQSSISEDANQGPNLTMGTNGLQRSESNWSFMEECSNDAGPTFGMNNAITMNGGGTSEMNSALSSAISTPQSQPNFGIGLGLVPPAATQSAPFNSVSEPQNGTISHNITSSQAQEMANTFVKWFYELLNSKTSEFRSDHFFPDASAKISLQSQNSADPAEYFHVQDNGKQVCSTLYEIAIKYKLTFNPNLCRDGVNGLIDPHGLVIVNVCGTLHNNSAASCCGTFHQQFGLVRDPFEGNNWKIKYTNANLISKSSVDQIPSLSQQPSLDHLNSTEQQSKAMALS